MKEKGNKKDQGAEEITKAELYFLLQEELKGYFKMMKLAQQKVLDEDISKYPILVIHQEEIQIGIELANRNKVNGNWSVHLSTLEEFVSKNLINDQKLQDFKGTFKNPEFYFCFFVLSELGAEFIFMPHPD